MRYVLLSGVIALSLAGCTLTVAEPPPPQGAELQGYIEEQQRRIPDASQSIEFSVGPEATGVIEVSLNGSNCLDRAQAFLSSIDVTTLTDDEVVRISAQYEAEMIDCENGVLLEPNEGGYFSAAQLDYLYDYFQDSLVPCLQLQGLEVGFAPSRSEFASSAGWIRWDPYSELGATLPPSRSAEIRSRCPEYPPAEFLGAR
jgi:hypothetical protein